MPTPKIAIRLPRQFIQEMRGMAHRESLKRGCNITWVQLLFEVGENYLRRQPERETTAY